MVLQIIKLTISYMNFRIIVTLIFKFQDVDFNAKSFLLENVCFSVTFQGKLLIFLYLVVFLKMFWKIFSGVWLVRKIIIS